MIGGFCGRLPAPRLFVGDYQRYGNLLIVLFRDDWAEDWDGYAEVELEVGFK